MAAAGFGSAAEVYERGRPSYPAEVVELFAAELGIGSGTTVVDLAAGTGKLTRLLVPTGANVVAVEPVEAMRAQLGAAVPDVDVREGTAEQLPFDDASLDAVTVAQAFHWFDPDAALAEIARVLRSGGGLGLVWNQRDESVPWVATLSELYEWGTRRPYERDADWAGTVAASGSFSPVQRRQLAFAQPMDADTLVDRVLSTSYVAARAPEDNAELEAAVRELVSGFPERFELPYVTDVYWCRRL